MNVVLAPEVKQWIDQEARRIGVEPEIYIAQRLNNQHALVRQFATVSADETTLLTKINEGLPASFWQRYRELIARRQAQLLNEEEQAELISLSDQVEQKNAARAPFLFALAQLRGISLPELIHQLKLQPASMPQ